MGMNTLAACLTLEHRRKLPWFNTASHLLGRVDEVGVQPVQRQLQVVDEPAPKTNLL